VCDKLENTESNEIKKGDFDSVYDIASMYGKTDPKELQLSIESGEYKRPLILNFNDRYYLVAGNTRLMTAAAMGVEPNVLIAKI
jgi:ParB-like chromosome segregation protein Spo0J